MDGFSLHAGVAIAAHDRAGLERLCRYAGRPALASARLTRLPDGQLGWRLKRPARNGATQLTFTPLALLRLGVALATIIPPPRRHQVRYLGVFAPHSRWRAAVVPTLPAVAASDAAAPAVPRVPATVLARRLDWAALLQRVFAVDVTRCTKCGGRRRVIAFLSTSATGSYRRAAHRARRRSRHELSAHLELQAHRQCDAAW